MQWEASSVRLTSFLASPQVSDYAALGDRLWAALGIGEPETASSAPRKAQITRVGKDEEGRLLTLTAAPDRFDLVIAAVPEDPFQIPSLGGSENARSIVQQLGERLGPSFPPSIRMAVGGIFMCVAGDESSQRELFSRAVPAFRPSVQTTDMLVRANRTAMSSVLSGISINQMASWEMFNSVVMSVGSGLTPVGGSNVFGISSTLDVNTNAKNVQPFDRPVELIRELLSLLVRRLQEGEL